MLMVSYRYLSRRPRLPQLLYRHAYSPSSSPPCSSIITAAAILHHLRGSAAEPYITPFLHPADAADKPFLTTYSGASSSRDYSRRQFLELGLRAMRVLYLSEGLKPGDRHLHWFSGNRVEDLALRWAAAVGGTVPVTVNWQADSLDIVAHKIRSADVFVAVTDEGVPGTNADALRRDFPHLRLLPADVVHRAEPLSSLEADALLSGRRPAAPSDDRIIIFTSGTTGRPKGVRLTFANYAHNRATFEAFLLSSPASSSSSSSSSPSSCSPLAAVLLNPLHHTNSSAISDWFIRRPNSRLHLLDRYSTASWRIVCHAATATPMHIALPETAAAASVQPLILPLVSRHIDFLSALASSNKLPVAAALLKACLHAATLLLGSAPVGPATVRSLLALADKLPTVRLGATETTLQICGIAPSFPTDQALAAFQRGWSHGRTDATADGSLVGYYVGRQHEGLTEVKVVRSVDPKSPHFLQKSSEGELGRLVTRGEQLMKGYLPPHASPMSADGWYLGLDDLGFWLAGQDGGEDLYWSSRASGVIIRGGANYSCEAIQIELVEFVEKVLGIDRSSFSLAVCGRRGRSEHDYEVCVLIETADDGARKALADNFLASARDTVSKGAKPDLFKIGAIPVVLSKGVVNVAELEKIFSEELI